LFCRSCQCGVKDAKCIISGKTVKEQIAYQENGRPVDLPPERHPQKNPEVKGARARLNRADHAKHIAMLQQVVRELDGMAPVRVITEMMGLDKCKTRTVYVWLCQLRDNGFTKSEGESRFRVWGLADNQKGKVDVGVGGKAWEDRDGR
jgi:hypothetical protein